MPFTCTNDFQDVDSGANLTCIDAPFDYRDEKLDFRIEMETRPMERFTIFK